jgi:acetyl-CoA carboxylase carboxyl transferase subunit alpha
MRVTAQDLKALGIIDRIVAEPVGGAHRNPAEAIAALGEAIGEELDSLAALSRGEVKADRRAKYLAIA